MNHIGIARRIYKNVKRALFVLLLAGGTFIASADETPVATVTLDNGSPTKDGSDWDWTYTITVANGDLNNVASFEIFDLSGVVNASAPWWDGWTASVTSAGGGLSDVTFTNNTDPCFECSLDGFTVVSTVSSTGNANYDVTYADNHHDDPVVGAPMAATPEPASVSLIGLPLLALAGFKARRKLNRNTQ
jgi:hypothetical protein